MYIVKYERGIDRIQESRIFQNGREIMDWIHRQNDLAKKWPDAESVRFLGIGKLCDYYRES